ncbi:hypothetical protein BB737_05675 [Mycobacterium avium subsp. hominissuis]|uniref:hypothetical protein n=1 Tax=Mycobacterium avium TaxID=1764 RepID=UPI0003922574|nr:hypothetical protein [Mycobacterium avium]ETA99583.1 hypothetical protein O982_06125 [Mycobacterium avium 10-5581]ATO63521.1 hypothetical protein BEP52_15425 [Mycobacterium avium subsp. hominissuis]ATO68060.1 hypothetical protein BJP78_15195 [Mycobacterium avium subsp. hominissuis]ATO72609.1 hypothetical protein BJP74_15115 [Mycobacterium avium subsp. hominissuis]PBJ42965.1 hypothetical protein BI294_02330 [Mycobacterium avium subsp. hominissuis]
MRYGGFLLLVLAVFTIARYWLWIVAAAGIVVALVVLWKMTGWLDRLLERRAARRAMARAERAAIIARAEEQNRLFLAGDDRGLYGEYPPPQDFSPESTTRRAEGR